MLTRVLLMLYAAVSYTVAMGSVVCLILTLAGLIPWGFFFRTNPGLAVPWNLGLVALWGAIHSLMARQGFKATLTRVVPEPAERATYVLVAGVTTFGLVGFWQTLPGTIWHVEGAAALALWGLLAFGWLYLVAATFAINHFDLFGLGQAWDNLIGRYRPEQPFVTRAMYRVTRHPIQTGVLIGVWATPVMSFNQFLLSLGFTAYIFIGLRLEERDLVQEFGATYEAYRKDTGMVLPKLRR